MNEFLDRMSEVLEEPVTPETRFRELAGYSSLKGFGLLVALENDWWRLRTTSAVRWTSPSSCPWRRSATSPPPPAGPFDPALETLRWLRSWGEIWYNSRINQPTKKESRKWAR